MRIAYLHWTVTVTAASLLTACATTSPEQLGFRRAEIRGQPYYCAAPEVAVPGSHSSAGEICLTRAQWPDYLLLRSRAPGLLRLAAAPRVVVNGHELVCMSESGQFSQSSTGSHLLHPTCLSPADWVSMNAGNPLGGGSPGVFPN